MREYIRVKRKVEWLIAIDDLTLKEVHKKLTLEEGDSFTYSYGHFARLTRTFFPEYVKNGRISKQLIAMNIDNIASKESPYERALEKPSCNESNVGEKETPPRKDNPEQTANNNTNRPADLPNEESEEDDLEGISEEAKRIAQKATDFFKKQEEFKQRNKKRG